MKINKIVRHQSNLLYCFKVLIFGFGWAAELLLKMHIVRVPAPFNHGGSSGKWEGCGREAFGSCDTWESLDSSESMWKATKRQSSSDFHGPRKIQHVSESQISRCVFLPELPPHQNISYDISCRRTPIPAPVFPPFRVPPRVHGVAGAESSCLAERHGDQRNLPGGEEAASGSSRVQRLVVAAVFSLLMLIFAEQYFWGD